MKIAFIEELIVLAPSAVFPRVINAHCSFSLIFKLYFPVDLSLHELNAFASTCMSNYFGFIVLLNI